MKHAVLIALMLLVMLCGSQTYAAGTSPCKYETTRNVVAQTFGPEEIPMQDLKDSRCTDFSMGLNYNHHPDLVWNGLAITRYSNLKDDKTHNDVHTFMISGKIIPDITSRTITPFLSGGLGVIRAAGAVEGLDGTFKPTGNVPETEVCLKAGAGMNVRLCRSLFLDLEADYFRGIKESRNPEQIRMVLGLSCRF